ncbi:MAG: hypothetical protein ACP5OG_01435 [Candidatus Nanoarchaeia archaeon]
MADYDVIGDIAIIKSECNGVKKTKKEKLKQAQELLKKPNIKTVLEKSSNVHGRLRTINAKYVAGEKKFIAFHKENNCTFKLDVRTCYFSPRLAQERKIIAEKIKSSQRVLVMFAGVGAYPIVLYKYAKPMEVVAIELGRECTKYFKENMKLNKISEEKMRVIQGDVNKKITKELGKFDVVLMPRPNLKPSFLKSALIASKKATRIYYYGFSADEEVENMTLELEKEAKTLKRKIKITAKSKAGDIAPYKHRYRIDIDVLK